MNNVAKSRLFITIDVGSASVKAISLEIADKNKRLVSVAEEKYANPVGGIEEQADKDTIVAALKKIAQNLKVGKNTTISASFFNREMQIRILDLPNQIQASQIEKTLNWEAKKLISPTFKDAPYTYAYKIIRKNPYSVALATVPTVIVDKYISLFKLAGIKLNGIYPEVFSGLSLRPMADIAGLPAVSIVNVGYYGTHLQIYSAGELRFYRYIPSGTSELSTPPDAGELEVFSQKIRFSFDFFRAVSKLSQIDLLCFMGGGAAIEGLLPYQQAYFAPTKIIPLDISSGIDIANAFVGSQEVAEDKQKKLLPFIPAVGISLASANDEAEKMNLLAQIMRKRRAEQLEKVMETIPIIVSLTIIIGIFTLILPRYNKIKEEISRSEANISSLNVEIESLKKEIKENLIYTKLELPAKYERVIGDSIKALQKEFYYEPLYHIKLLAKRNNGINLQELLIKNEEEAKEINLLPIDKLMEEDQSYEEEEPPTIETEKKDNPLVKVTETNILNNSELSNDMLDIGLDSLETKPNAPIENNSVLPTESVPKTDETSNNNFVENPAKLSIKKDKIKEADKYHSSLTQGDPEEQNSKECYEGKIAIIKGVAIDLESLGKYIDSLVLEGLAAKKENESQSRCLLRIRSLASRQTDDGIEFLLKGDLP